MIGFQTIWDILAIISFAGTVIGLVIAIWQLKMAEKANNHLLSQIKTILDKEERSIRSLDQIAKDLKEVDGSLSTKYIGEFPDYLEQVRDLLRKAKKRILTAYITPTPGIFNAIAVWIDIRNSIAEKLKPGSLIEVRGVFPIDSVLRVYVEEQFKSELADWSTWRAKPEFLAKLNVLTQRYTNIRPDASNLTEEEFKDSFILAAKSELRSAYSGAQIKLIDFKPQIHMWVVDDEAIFALYGKRKLIHALR